MMPWAFYFDRYRTLEGAATSVFRKKLFRQSKRGREEMQSRRKPNRAAAARLQLSVLCEQELTSLHWH